MLPADVRCSNFMVLEIVASKFKSGFMVFPGNNNNTDTENCSGFQLLEGNFKYLHLVMLGIKVELKSWSAFHSEYESLNSLSRRGILVINKQDVCLLWYALICLASL